MSTESQKRLRAESKRRYRLEQALKSGKVPYPRKPAPWLLQLYQKYGVEHLVPIPMAHVDEATMKVIRGRMQKIKGKLRREFRDQLPAQVDRREFNVMFKAYYESKMSEIIHNNLQDVNTNVQNLNTS